MGGIKQQQIDPYCYSHGRGFSQEDLVIGNFTYYVVNSGGVLRRDKTSS